MEQTKQKGKKKSNNELFAQYLGIYLVSGFDGRSTDELEIRFGTKFWNPITQIDFNNVIAKLKSAGFVCNDPNGKYHLNINNQYTDPRTGHLKISNIRTEIQSIFGKRKRLLSLVIGLWITNASLFLFSNCAHIAGFWCILFFLDMDLFDYVLISA